MFDWTLAGLLYLIVELIGIASAVHVLLQGRTPQGVTCPMKNQGGYTPA